MLIHIFACNSTSDLELFKNLCSFDHLFVDHQNLVDQLFVDQHLFDKAIIIKVLKWESQGY